jgi:hypothetical protein
METLAALVATVPLCRMPWVRERVKKGKAHGIESMPWLLLQRAAAPVAAASSPSDYCDDGDIAATGSTGVSPVKRGHGQDGRATTSR